jgi:branched-chain amino acid transport system substrate-binding protein
MRKGTRFGAALALAATFAFAGSTSAESANEPLRLPFPYIFSGPLVDFGERVWNEGILPAVAAINSHGGIKGRPLEFYKVDVRFPDTAAWITEFRRLCEDKNLPIIFGVGATKSLVAIYEETRQCGVPVFNPSSTGAWPEKDYAGWIFRYQPTPEDVLPVVFKEAKARNGLQRIAITYSVDDEYAVYNLHVAENVLKALNIEIVTEQSIRSKETNFASQVSAIRASNPNGLMLLHQPGDMGTMLLQLRERGVDAPVYGDANVGGADFWRLSKGAAKGAIGYSLYSATDPRPIVQEWVKLWREKTGRAKDAPDGFVTAYYDGAMVLAHVLNDASSLDRNAIRDAFLRVSDIETISGTITWTKPGEVTRAKPVLVQVGDDDVLKTWP